MRRAALFVIVITACLTPGCAIDIDPPLDYRGVQQAEWAMVELDGQDPVPVQYLLYLPDLYELYDHWPMILFIHGAQERGGEIEELTRYGLPRLLEQGMTLPFVVVSPHWPDDVPWDLDVLGGFLDEMERTHDIDPDRVYVTGLSEGAVITYDLAAAFPDRFAAIAPVAGAGDPATAEAIVDVPVWAFHIRWDVRVPLALVEETVTLLDALGGEVRLTVYPAIGHGGWSIAYQTMGLYDWFLTHER